MRDGHRIQLIGNLGQDPEMRYTPSGAAVTNFSVAVNRRYTDGDGAQQQETIWVRVTCWNRTAGARWVIGFDVPMVRSGHIQPPGVISDG